MITVGDLIDELIKYNPDYKVYAHEGMESGIVILNLDGKEVRFIVASERE